MKKQLKDFHLKISQVMFDKAQSFLEQRGYKNMTEYISDLIRRDIECEEAKSK